MLTVSPVQVSETILYNAYNVSDIIKSNLGQYITKSLIIMKHNTIKKPKALVRDATTLEFVYDHNGKPALQKFTVSKHIKTVSP